MMRGVDPFAVFLISTGVVNAYSVSPPAFVSTVSLSVSKKLPLYVPSTTALRNSGNDGEVIYGGNTWKPDSGGMRSTDTPDYFPEGYEEDVSFTEGMRGSQGMYNKEDGPALPGMENLGADAVMMGGLDDATFIPEGMKFIPSPFPDETVQMKVAASGKATLVKVDVQPVCMTFEDYYAAFCPGSHRSFSVAPQFGRMDRRGGESTALTIMCDPRGQAGKFEGDLVINLPEDNSSIHYKVIAESF